MSTIEAHILSTLLANSQSETATNAKMLSEELCVDKSNVSRACARMEKYGLLTNEPCPVDARRKWLRLTAEGVGMAETVESESRKKFTELLAVLPSSTAEEITSALDCLSEAIKKTR